MPETVKVLDAIVSAEEKGVKPVKSTYEVENVDPVMAIVREEAATEAADELPRNSTDEPLSNTHDVNTKSAGYVSDVRSTSCCDPEKVQVSKVKDVPLPMKVYVVNVRPLYDCASMTAGAQSSTKRAARMVASV